jgi:hypothetical protein
MLLLGFVIWVLAAFLNQFLMQTRLFVVHISVMGCSCIGGFQSALQDLRLELLAYSG